MRLSKTLLTTAAVLAVSGTAFAATTRDELNTTLGGTSRVAAGGKFKLVITHKPGKPSVGVVMKYDVSVRSKTVLGFTAYPCKSTSCDGKSTSTIKLNPGLRHVTFNGRVPFVKRDDGFACVYAQVRDQGAKAKKPGQVVKHGKSKGVSFCFKTKSGT
jgi:hypothetical protein